jgi:hypothetical protein
MMIPHSFSFEQGGRLGPDESASVDGTLEEQSLKNT